MKLDTLAQTCYFEVLRLHDDSTTDATADNLATSSNGTLVCEAAHNVALMYAKNGDSKLAQTILEKYNSL